VLDGASEKEWGCCINETIDPVVSGGDVDIRVSAGDGPKNERAG
jgi:hypothetical protein